MSSRDRRKTEIKAFEGRISRGKEQERGDKQKKGGRSEGIGKRP